MDLSKIGSLLFSFVLPRIKNSKIIRDFKDKWMRDNYALKTKLMFEAGIADAKASLDLPDELIDELLNDKQIREEIFLWIIEGKKLDDFNRESLFLEPYYERYPTYQDQLIPFFQLILANIDEYKEKEWDPEFLEILNKLEMMQEEFRSDLNQISSQNNQIIQNQGEITTLISNALLPVGYEDLKELNSNDHVITAREKATERLKYAKTQEEILQLQLVIANSYMASGLTSEAIPHLYTSISNCNDEYTKNRLLSIVKMNEENYEEALMVIEKNLLSEGYKSQNVEILVTIKFNQQKYEECLSILQEHGEGAETIKIQIYIALNMFEDALSLCTELLSKNPDSNDLLLFKADAMVHRMESTLQNDDVVDLNRLSSIVIPILDKVQNKTENIRQLIKVNELKAAVYFREKQFGIAAEHYKFIVQKSNDVFNRNNNIYVTNLIFCYYINEDWQKAIEQLEDKISEQSNIDFITFLVRIYLEKGDPENAYYTLEKYESNYISENENIIIEFCLLKLETLYVLRKYNELHQFIEEVEEKQSSKLIMNTIKGYYSALTHDWENAIKHLEPLLEKAEGELLIEIKLKLLNSYSKRGKITDLNSIVKIVPTIPYWKNHEQMVNYYVMSHYRLENYDLILDIYYNSLTNPSIMVKEVVAAIYFNNYWYELSKEIYEKLYHETQDINYLLMAASSDFNLGNKKKYYQALKIAEKQILDNETVNDLQLLSSAYLDAREYDMALKYAYAAYKLGEKNPDVWKYYASVFLHINKFVKDPKKEFIEDFQKVLTEFDKYFPDEEPFMQRKQIIENDQLHSDIVNMLEEDRKTQSEIIKTFKKNRLHGSFLAMVLGKGNHLTWSFIANDKSLYFWVNQQGSILEESQGIKKVIKAKNILLDIFSLFTLNELNLLNNLAGEFHIYFDQKSYLDLCKEHTDLLLTGDEGIKTISYLDGRIYSHEATPKEVQKDIETLEKIIHWIDQNCKKVGRAVFDDNKSKEKKFIKNIENPTLICQQGLASLMIDNFLFDIYAAEHNVETFNVMDFVRYLFIEGKITKNQYYEYTSELIIMGYSYIRTEPSLYIYLLNKNNC
ncbi:PIN domain-containing protein [Oceanobacillus salinisoli]|uniref:PIN domain-containing protein n=1 Tax=Oceanobacillus salinisoli TaxID=2678611 RepID=UPI0012E0D926|nr:hypothetical protein [Oceanobacillus salinisoli]